MPDTTDLGVEGYSDAVLVGRGGFASVYRARQTKFDRIIAVKVFHHVESLDAKLDTFTRECRVVGRLDTSPNIVTVYDAGVTANGEPFLVMEFAAGGSLAEKLRRDGPLDARSVSIIGAKVAEALASAHEAGVLHRDVKPANILLSRTGEPMLADFGVATLSGGTQTTAGVIAATIAHVAPEALAGEPRTEASDIYSLASTLFTLLAGRPPYATAEDDSIVTIIAAR